MKNSRERKRKKRKKSKNRKIRKTAANPNFASSFAYSSFHHASPLTQAHSTAINWSNPITFSSLSFIWDGSIHEFIGLSFAIENPKPQFNFLRSPTTAAGSSAALDYSTQRTATALQPLSLCLHFPFGTQDTPPTSIPSTSFLVSWIPPSATSVKLNFDGSSTTSSASASFIIRDTNGTCLVACAYNLGVTSPLLAEIIALRNGLAFAVAEGFTHLEIEGDNLIVINSIKGLFKPPWKIHSLVQEISALLTQFQCVSIAHIYREGNRAADWIANVGHLVSDSIFIDCSPPSQLHVIVEEDRLGKPLARRAT